MGEHAVDHAVANAAVAPQRVMADDTVLLCAKRFDRALRPEIEVVGAQPYDRAFQGFECVAEEEKLARGIDVAALATPCIPGIADLDAVRSGDDIVITGAAHHFSRRQTHHPGQHVSSLLSFERGVDVRSGLAGRWNAGEPKLPQLS